MTELEKLKGIVEESQKIGEFLEWLKEIKKYIICSRSEREIEYSVPYIPITEDTEELLAEYFGIDLKKMEEEKREILASELT